MGSVSSIGIVRASEDGDCRVGVYLQENLSAPRTAATYSDRRRYLRYLLWAL